MGSNTGAGAFTADFSLTEPLRGEFATVFYAEMYAIHITTSEIMKCFRFLSVIQAAIRDILISDLLRSWYTNAEF